MENSLEFATINWLTATPSIKFHLNDDCPQYARSAIPMDEKIGHGWLEITPLAIGMYLTHVHYHFTDQMYGQTVVLHSMQGELKEPTLIITSPKIGRVGHKDYCVGGVYAFGAGQTLFKLVDRIDHQPTFDASSEIEVTILGVGMSVLRDFLGNELSGVLLEKLRLPHCRTAAVHLVPTALSKHLHMALQNQFTGTMRILFAQAKVLEYICELARYVAQIDNYPEYGAEERANLITQLHDDLVSLVGKVPTLEVLARNYAISARILNDEFKQKYGSSIFNYITELRLTQAHDVLRRSKTPMKTIANNLGYSHVNHFINAFRKKFGYSPGTLRRKQEGK